MLSHSPFDRNDGQTHAIAKTRWFANHILVAKGGPANRPMSEMSAYTSRPVLGCNAIIKGHEPQSTKSDPYDVMGIEPLFSCCIPHYQ